LLRLPRYVTAKALAEAGVPVTVILDSAMGYMMEKVDFVVVGAEGVVENGDIVNKELCVYMLVCSSSKVSP
jgi:translation initiation factor eIF-2B subunit alpha